MRQRFRFGDPRPMARRSGEERRFALSPRARLISGWLAAIVLVLGIAVVVGILGGNGDGAPVGGSPPASTDEADAGMSITFGTALDESSGQVAEAAVTARFAAGDRFAYSVPPGPSTPPAVYVEVQRTGGGEEGVVQEPVAGQPLPNPSVIAFTVPADDLLDVFGPGEYLMRIYAEPTGEPIASGTFELVGTEPSASS